MFHGISTWEQIFFLLRARFRGFDGKGGGSLPGLLVDFDRGLFPSRMSLVRSSVILNGSGGLCDHYYIVGHETTARVIQAVSYCPILSTGKSTFNLSAKDSTSIEYPLEDNSLSARENDTENLLFIVKE